MTSTVCSKGGSHVALKIYPVVLELVRRCAPTVRASERGSHPVNAVDSRPNDRSSCHSLGRVLPNCALPPSTVPHRQPPSDSTRQGRHGGWGRSYGFVGPRRVSVHGPLRLPARRALPTWAASPAIVRHRADPVASLQPHAATCGMLLQKSASRWRHGPANRHPVTACAKSLGIEKHRACNVRTL
jgi:hypothetical protein